MEQGNEIQSCRRLLSEISEMCEHASLTGSLSGGEKRTAQRYNAVLNRLVELGAVSSGLFSPVPEDCKFGAIGVEARMLASALPSNKDKDRGRHGDDNDKNIILRLAPFIGQDELGQLVREHAIKGSELDINTISNLAPFLGQDFLGELLRGHLSKERKGTPAAPPEPKSPTAPAASPAAKPDYLPEPVVEASETVDDLINLLKSPYLSDEERDQVSNRLKAAIHRQG